MGIWFFGLYLRHFLYNLNETSYTSYKKSTRNLGFGYVEVIWQNWAYTYAYITTKMRCLTISHTVNCIKLHEKLIAIWSAPPNAMDRSR